MYMYMYMYTYVYMYMLMYMYIYIYIYICMFMYMYVYMYRCTCLYVYVYVYVYVSVATPLIPGRHMLDNVLGVEGVVQRIALEGPQARILLVDIKAAFPFSSHDTIWKTMQEFGLSDKHIWARVQGRPYPACPPWYGPSSTKGDLLTVAEPEVR